METRGNELKHEYNLRFSKIAPYRNQLWRILCERYFNAFISPDMSVLDLGSGWGEFINNIQAARKFAMDLNPEAGQRLTDNTRFLNQDCAQTWPLPDDSLDVVFTSNFLEHLPDKAHVERSVAEAHRCLKPGGLIICLGPNIKYLPGAYWDFWDHFSPLTELSVSELLALRGFGIHLQLARFLPYSMSTGWNPPLFFTKWYLRLPLFWPLFGKQFLVIGKKQPKVA